MRKNAFLIVLAFALLVSLAPAAVADGGDGVKLMAITFDDGPSSKYTPVLLDALKERGVKATFFVCGSMAQYNKDIVLRAYEEGHQIASHTWSHSSLTGISDKKIREEISSTENLLAEITGLTNFMVRPPYGNVNANVASIVDRPLIMWSIDPTNGVHPTSQEKMKSRIISSAHDGAIILMHDTSAANIYASIDAIDALLSEGYEFVTVNELFRLKGIIPENGTQYRKITGGDMCYFDEARLNEHWAAVSIEYVKNAGVMLGGTDGFGPNKPMTRAMAVTVLWRLAQESGDITQKETVPLNMNSEDTEDAGPEYVGSFEDVPYGQWYSEAIEWAVEAGIVQGCSTERFGTNDNITREQFYVILDRYRQSLGRVFPVAENAAHYGDDSRVGDWAFEAVMHIRSAGFKSINDVELFRPRDFITRAEAAELTAWFMRGNCGQSSRFDVSHTNDSATFEFQQLSARLRGVLSSL